MSRPGFTTILAKSSPPMMFNAGDGFHYEKLPEGTRVIYPPGPQEPLPDPNVAIERALLEPLDMEPLHDLLFPGMLGTEAYKPELGKPVVMGGAEKVFECVGAPGTMEDAVRLTEPGGEVTLVGMPGAKSSLDLTALWYKEVRLAGSYAYGVEEYEGEKTSSFGLALRIAPEIKLETLVGPGFRLEEYREAIRTARAAGREGNVKVVFDHRS